MLSTWLDFTLLTLFNAVICVFLPRLLTLDWQEVFAQLKGESDTLPEITGEEIPNPALVTTLDSSLQN